MILTYLIKSGLCLAILLAFYKIALESKAMHQFKRFYLLASMAFSFTIPLITFTYTSSEVVEVVEVIPEYTGYTATLWAKPAVAIETSIVDYTPHILLSLYCLGLLLFGIKFFLNLLRLKRKINLAETYAEKDFTLALLNQTMIPHSFFKWIFLNRDQYHNHEIAPEVLAHEATHVRQKHSWDILIIEILQIIFWFNPLLWLTKKAIKLNHEFLADQGVLQQENNIEQYQNILFGYAKGTDHPRLESAINYSLTKKRILMMSQTFSRKRVAISTLLLIPVLVLSALLFNNEIKAQPKPSEQAFKTERHLTARNVDITLLTENTFIVNGVPATRASLEKTLIKFNKDLTKEERDRVINFHVTADGEITSTDLQFLQKVASNYGYHRILVNEKEEIIRSKNNHPAYDHPARQGHKQWEDNSKYTINIDNKKVSNERLKDKKTAPQQGQQYNYADQFVKGAQDNGKKALVIEIKSNTIKINGIASSLKTFRKDINAVTIDWEEQEYTAAIPSFLFKDNFKDFLILANSEFKKTHFSKANDGLALYTNISNAGTILPVQKSKDNISPLNDPTLDIIYDENKHKGGKKFFMTFFDDVIEINNVRVLLNDFAETVDLYTQNWDAIDFENQRNSIVILAQNRFDTFISTEFRDKVNKEYRKTTLSKKTTRKNLIPTEDFLEGTPPEFLKDWKSLSNATSLVHLREMDKLGSLFYQEDEEISFHQAMDLARTHKDLNILTPVPYSTPPKTYLTIKPHSNLKNQSPPTNTNEIKNGETITITEDKTGKSFTVTLESQKDKKLKENIAKELSEKLKLTYIQNPATKKQIEEYSKWAKMHNLNPNGIIKSKTLEKMYDIYNRMTLEQRKNAEPYPALPPPPPPAPTKVVKGKKVIKGKNDGDKNNPPPPPPAKTKYVYVGGSKERGKNQPVIIEIEEEVMRDPEEEIEIIEVLPDGSSKDVIIIKEIEEVSPTIEVIEEISPKLTEIIIENPIEHEVEINSNDLIKEGATFYLDNEKISNRKARKLFKNTDGLSRIDISKPKNGKPIVHLSKK